MKLIIRMPVMFFFVMSVLLTACNSENAFNDNEKKLVSIQITPVSRTVQGISDLTVISGLNQGFVAIGYYSDGNSEDITASVSWQSTEKTVAIMEGPVLTGVERGVTEVSATKGGIVSNSLIVTIVDARLDSIQVTPKNSKIAKGNSIKFYAQGSYSNGMTADITNVVSFDVSDSNILIVTKSGEAIGVEVGDVTVTAHHEAIRSNSADVSVTDAILESIDVSPQAINLPKGNNATLTAMGTYSDGHTADITDNVTWESSDNSIVSVSQKGLISGLAEGATTVVASQNGVNSNNVNIRVTSAVLESIQVTPATASLAKGNTTQLIARGFYSDGTSENISNSVSWKSSTPSLLTITESGLATGLVEGSVTIVATKNGIDSNLVNITVTSAVLESIQVTPASISLAKGNSVRLTAQGLYSDGSSANISDSVAWLPSDNAVITVSASGLLTADNVGHGTVVATKDSVSSNTVTVVVTSATLESITVTPNILELAKGNTFQLVAEGRYSDETKVDMTHSVTWKSSESTLVSIDKLGVVTGKNEGSVEIHASKESVNSNKVEVSVTSAVLNEIQLTPKINSVPKGNSTQLNAQGLYSDGSIVDLSSAVTWKSSDPSLVTITESGVATGVTEGDVSIVASKEGIDSNEAAVTVTAALLHTIQVSPATITLGKGKSSQLTAIGLYTDGSSANISDQVTWKSYNNALVTVTPTGLLTGISVGKATVEASKDNVYGNDVIVDVTTTCVNPTIARNQLIELIKAENINAIETFDTSCITDMSELFSNSMLNDLDLTGWDTSNVTSMQLMFLNASNFNGDLSSWDVSSVRTMSGMFHSARAFNGDISLWNTSNVTVMDEVFFSASSFNGNLSGWDVSKASSMRMMFYGARKFNSDISTWNTSRVWRMSNMFENASAFDQNISGWNTSNVESMSYMFAGASSFNQDLSGWNVGKVKSSNNFVNYLSNREFTSEKHPKFK